ncbi:Ras-specific guanine nucleotide-releasing factor 2, partial [Clonorchis sinensis]
MATRLSYPCAAKLEDPGDLPHCFAIYYSKEGVRQYDLRADTEEECHLWVDAINNASFGKMLEQKQEAEQKQLHLLQILETERRAKWHYVKQIEDLTAEVKKLKSELNEYRTERRASPEYVAEADELRKIKKVQSFFRGWLCRRRWKQIVEDYIRSEHAESMRRRNSIVFGLVECEDEYVQQLSILVTCYLRPFRMAASSKKPIILHEDVNSIFLNV